MKISVINSNRAKQIGDQCGAEQDFNFDYAIDK